MLPVNYRKMFINSLFSPLERALIAEEILLSQIYPHMARINRITGILWRYVEQRQ